MRILVTGGCGFVGSNLALCFQSRYPKAQVVSFDNLRRRGSELAIPRLKSAGVHFHHGDIRLLSDLKDAGGADLIVECSAEPSVHAGYGESPAYLIQTNLMGTMNALELARLHKSTFLFLSSSRVYPIAPISSLPFEEEGHRFSISAEKSGTGWSSEGISVDFPLKGARSLYGATKLASELLIEEYSEMYSIPAIVNRCGVLAGPWQMGKVDQGFVSLWAARHFFGGKLRYMGFGGSGKQVRDILHVKDLFELLVKQIEQGTKELVYNVGGGKDVSLSLLEATKLCTERSQPIPIGSEPETRPADIPWFVTDSAEAREEFCWSPRYTPAAIFDDLFQWLESNQQVLKPLLCPGEC
jgi:CDP-paratose 2-epimerase